MVTPSNVACSSGTKKTLEFGQVLILSNSRFSVLNESDQTEQLLANKSTMETSGEKKSEEKKIEIAVNMGTHAIETMTNGNAEERELMRIQIQLPLLGNRCT